MGYEIQDENEDAKVKVFGENTDGTTGQPQTDFIITEPGYPDEHRHIVIDENGDERFDKYRPNH